MYNDLKREHWMELHTLIMGGYLCVKKWSDGAFFLVYMLNLHNNFCVTAERALDVNSVEYGKITIMRDRWGKALLQVKDQKYSNLKVPRRRKTAKVNVEDVASA